MPAFLVVMFLIYGAMHFYALGKIWKAFPYSVTFGFMLAGIDDHTMRELHQEINPETKQALATVSKNDFIILLKHQPVVVDTETPFDLQLSGHIHGGQIFSFGLFTWLEYRVHTGLTPLPDGRRLYVSRGTGTWGLP